MIRFHNKAARSTLAVYRVSLDLGTHMEPLMIGVCHLSQVYDLLEPRQRVGWDDAVNGTHSLAVEILHTGTDRRETDAMAVFHIAASQPRPHLQDAPPVTRSNLRGAPTTITCVETGERWPSMTALATELGVTVPAVSKHLSNKQPTLQGRTYRKA